MEPVMNAVDKSFSRLVLGTAQLGMPYGIANRSGKPDVGGVHSIVQTAWKGGVRCFDTAQVYGDSEQLLGQAIRQLPSDADKAWIITKLDPMLNLQDHKAIGKAVRCSLKHLSVKCLYGLMLHSEDMLPALNNGLKDLLSGYRRDGLIGHAGISVYTPEKALQALRTDIIDLVQVPTNLLDRRFLDAGVFHLAREKGKEIFIRSVFLQGLLLMNEDNLPATMEFARPVIRSLQALSERFGIPRIVLALGYVRLRFPQARVIFGAETPVQVMDNLRCWTSDLPESLLEEIDETFSHADRRMVDPRQWPR
jgi:aryl-alcohol dehydrogenase-like predicted oxidoreductase